MLPLLPFSAIRYNLDHVSSLSDVIAAQSELDGQEDDDSAVDRLYKKHPANVVRLIANREEPGDEPGDRFERAGEFVEQWIDEGVLRRDDDAGFDIYCQIEGESRRTGIIGLIRITDPVPTQDEIPSDENSVSRWVEATGMFARPAISLCRDLSLVDLNALLLRANSVATATDHRGRTHQMHRCSDPESVAAIHEMLSFRKPTRLGQEPGYQAAHDYRDSLARAQGGLSDDHPANFLLTWWVDEDVFCRDSRGNRPFEDCPFGMLFHCVASHIGIDPIALTD